LFVPFRPRGQARRVARKVVDMIGGENLICCNEIPLGKDLLKETTDERLVVFG
jgi:hypothetical protein